MPYNQYTTPFIGGSLDPNKFKTADNHPDFRGDLTIDDELLAALNALAKAGQPVKMSLGGWSKKRKSGDRYISLKASEDRRAASTQAQASRQATPTFAPDEDIPF